MSAGDEETARHLGTMGNSQGTIQSEEDRRQRIRQMDQQMNRRFGRSSKHTMRLVIRGEKETGKSSIGKLLSGGLFDPVYTASDPDKPEEVTVPWVAGPGEDVSLTLCVVTEPNTRKDDKDGAGSLKITHVEKNKFAAKRDRVKDLGAAHYKESNGVIVMVDPTKEWTFSFARDIIEQVPAGLEVLMVANFRDRMDSWVSSRDVMQKFVAGCGEHVHYCETCLQNM